MVCLPVDVGNVFFRGISEDLLGHCLLRFVGVVNLSYYGVVGPWRDGVCGWVRGGKGVSWGETGEDASSSHAPTLGLKDPFSAQRAMGPCMGWPVWRWLSLLVSLWGGG